MWKIHFSSLWGCWWSNGWTLLFWVGLLRSSCIHMDNNRKLHIYNSHYTGCIDSKYNEVAVFRYVTDRGAPINRSIHSKLSQWSQPNITHGLNDLKTSVKAGIFDSEGMKGLSNNTDCELNLAPIGHGCSCLTSMLLHSLHYLVISSVIGFVEPYFYKDGFKPILRTVGYHLLNSLIVFCLINKGQPIPHVSGSGFRMVVRVQKYRVFVLSSLGQMQSSRWIIYLSENDSTLEEALQTDAALRCVFKTWY